MVDTFSMRSLTDQLPRALLLVIPWEISLPVCLAAELTHRLDQRGLLDHPACGPILDAAKTARRILPLPGT